MKLKLLTFSRDRLDFTSAVNKNVSDYFKNNGKTRHGNAEMFTKTIFMFVLYFLPYGLIIGGVITGPFLIAMVLLMSLGLAGIGLSVMHDANHGAYSKYGWLNTLVGYSLNVIGASVFNWKMQHNVLHHTYTNVHGHDEDIVSRGVLRLSPKEPWQRVYRYQYIYAWFLYGLMTLAWMFFKDFARLVKYNRNGLVKKYNANIYKEWIILILTKAIYIGYMVVVPIFFTTISWPMIVLGVVLMHCAAGFLLSIIFQPAHINDVNEFPEADEANKLPNNWAIHQLITTTNFGKNRLFSWYIGGLNFQIEHHLFPNVCHVHYRKIARIVESTALEYGLPYKSSKTFYQALKAHANLLKSLGSDPQSLNPANSVNKVF